MKRILLTALSLAIPVLLFANPADKFYHESKSIISNDGGCDVSFTVRNTGKCDAYEAAPLPLWNRLWASDVNAL